MTETTADTKSPASEKPASPFKPTSHPAAQAGGVSGVPTDWTPDVLPSDGSPTKTVVRPPKGHTPYKWRPKTVAEHNAYVDELAAKRFPVR
jgi:hypothetical protein